MLMKETSDRNHNHFSTSEATTTGEIMTDNDENKIMTNNNNDNHHNSRLNHGKPRWHVHRQTNRVSLPPPACGVFTGRHSKTTSCCVSISTASTVARAPSTLDQRPWSAHLPLNAACVKSKLLPPPPAQLPCAHLPANDAHLQG